MRILRGLIYAGLFGFGVVAGTYLLIRVSFSGTGTLVPPVKGLTLEQAQFQAKRAHLQFMVQTERFDLQAEKGRVVDQIPAAGMATRRGMTLAVVVSKGVERIQMPALVGMRMDEAQIQVRQAGLNLFSTAYVHSGAPTQTVAAQDPAPSTTVPKESDVSLLVSIGAENPVFVAPDLRGMPGERAQAQLQAWGIQASLVRPSAAHGGQNLVVAQSPGPGMPLGRGDVLQLTVGQP